MLGAPPSLRCDDLADPYAYTPIPLLRLAAAHITAMDQLGSIYEFVDTGYTFRRCRGFHNNPNVSVSLQSGQSWARVIFSPLCAFAVKSVPPRRVLNRASGFRAGKTTVSGA